MNNQYKEINRNLDNELGAGVAKIKQDPQRRYPYVLHFRDDNPSQKTIETAKRIVNAVMPSRWFDNKSRKINKKSR